MPLLSGRPSPAPFGAGSFSRALRPLRSVFACLPGHSLRSDAVLPGVSSLFAALSGGVHLRGMSQSPATFRPQVFSTSRRLAPPPALRACFIPQPRPGFSVQGFLPLRSASVSSTVGCLPALFRTGAHRLPGCHTCPSGLRGFGPRSDAFDRTRGLALSDVAPLFGLPPPPGIPRPIRIRSVPGCPVSARDVCRRHLRRRVATVALVSPLRLQRCPGSSAGSRVFATTDLLEVSA
jgi:hypothetical protein